MSDSALASVVSNLLKWCGQTTFQLVPLVANHPSPFTFGAIMQLVTRWGRRDFYRLKMIRLRTKKTSRTVRHYAGRCFTRWSCRALLRVSVDRLRTVHSISLAISHEWITHWPRSSISVKSCRHVSQLYNLQ